MLESKLIITSIILKYSLITSNANDIILIFIIIVFLFPRNLISSIININFYSLI